MITISLREGYYHSQTHLLTTEHLASFSKILIITTTLMSLCGQIDLVFRIMLFGDAKFDLNIFIQIYIINRDAYIIVIISSVATL